MPSPELLSPEQKPAKPRQEIILSITNALDSDEFQACLSQESLSGNAGPGKRAVNAYVDCATGQVLALGNQILPDYEISDSVAQLSFLEDAGSGDIQGFIETAGTPRLSTAARENIAGALEVLRRVKNKDFEP